jgi:hypothetical protein
MVDYASTHARAKGVAPTGSQEEGHTKATATMPPKASPPPTADGVNKMYRQLAEIHAITAAQLAECTRWCRSNPTPNTAQTGIGWREPATEPSTTRTAPPADTDDATFPGIARHHQEHHWAAVQCHCLVHHQQQGSPTLPGLEQQRGGVIQCHHLGR